MALTTVTLVYDQNSRVRGPTGDLVQAVYDVAVDSAGPNAYPAGGEPLLSAALDNLFIEIFDVQIGPVFGPGAAGAGADGDGLLVGGYVADSAVDGRVRFYESAGAAAPLSELAAGAYPHDLSFRMVVTGRPSTDQA